MFTFETSFWIGLGVLLYTYFGYPIILFIASKFSSPREIPLLSVKDLPTVTMIIAAYNEEKVIAAKLDNCLVLDYPADKLDFIVASDGSSDGTNALVSAWAAKNPRVKLLSLPRGGKSAAINAAMAEAKGEIVVFSDANTVYDAASLKNLVRHFADNSVGCVCGRLSYNNPGKVISGKGEGAYWRYETALKKMESRLGYVAGANGAIYAIRRGLFSPLPDGTINDDFMISMRIIQQGFKCLYEEAAIAYEEVAPNVKSEFRRHVRDGSGHYIAVRRLPALLNPALGIRSFIYWSHRILRWVAPFVLIAVFSANAALSGMQPYRGLFLLQTAFYLLAIAGYAASGTGRAPFILYAPFYFANLNLALLLGFFRAVSGRARPAWQSTQRGDVV